MYLVDTNVISELRRLNRCDSHVRAWSEAQPRDHLFCSCVSVMELQIGAHRARRSDVRKADILQGWIEGIVLRNFEGRVLDVNLEIAIRCAALHVPNPRPDRDAYIAATALVHDLTVVTRNTRDFEGTGVRLFDPWEERA